MQLVGGHSTLAWLFFFHSKGQFHEELTTGVNTSILCDNSAGEICTTQGFWPPRYASVNTAVNLASESGAHIAAWLPGCNVRLRL